MAFVPTEISYLVLAQGEYVVRGRRASAAIDPRGNHPWRNDHSAIAWMAGSTEIVAEMLPGLVVETEANRFDFHAAADCLEENHFSGTVIAILRALGGPNEAIPLEVAQEIR